MLMPLAIHVALDQPSTLQGVQSLHDVPDVRLGGIVVVVACAITMAMVLRTDMTMDSKDSRWCSPRFPCAVRPCRGRDPQVRPRFRMAAAVSLGNARQRLFGRHRPASRPAVHRRLLQHLWFVLPLTWFMVGLARAVR
jgi:hypothetical protein